MAKKAKTVFDPKAFLATVNHGRSIATFPKGGVIFVQASPADAVFYIQKGKIKIVVASKQGKEAVVALLGPGDFFGEGCLIGQPLRLATARALVETDVMRVGKTEMMRVLHAEPAFGELFIAHLLTRNSRVEEDLVDQLFNSSEKRLARTLSVAGEFRQGGRPAADHDPDQPGDAGRNHRHHAPARQPFHKQIQEVGLHQLQRPPARPQLPAERRTARRRLTAATATWRSSGQLGTDSRPARSPMYVGYRT